MCINARPSQLGDDYYWVRINGVSTFLLHLYRTPCLAVAACRALAAGSAIHPLIHLSYGACLEVRGKIIRTVLCCIVY